MKKDILIVKNITREGPGLLEALLKKRNIAYHVVDLDQGEIFPAVENYGALVVLGGPDSANDSTEKMQKELVRIQEALSKNIPYLGICLGLQTLVKVAGGKVVKSPLKEIGFRDPNGEFFTVELTKAGKEDDLFKNLGNSFNVFHLHGETVELGSNMELLATGKFCQNQIVRVGKNAYGIQCHFELTPEMFKTWLNQDPDLLAQARPKLEADFEKLREAYTKTGYQLLENFLEIAGY